MSTSLCKLTSIISMIALFHGQVLAKSNSFPGLVDGLNEAMDKVVGKSFNNLNNVPTEYSFEENNKGGKVRFFSCEVVDIISISSFEYVCPRSDRQEKVEIESINIQNNLSFADWRFIIDTHRYVVSKYYKNETASPKKTLKVLRIIESIVKICRKFKIPTDYMVTFVGISIHNTSGYTVNEEKSNDKYKGRNILMIQGKDNTEILLDMLYRFSLKFGLGFNKYKDAKDKPQYLSEFNVLTMAVQILFAMKKVNVASSLDPLAEISKAFKSADYTEYENKSENKSHVPKKVEMFENKKRIVDEVSKKHLAFEGRRSSLLDGDLISFLD